MIGHAYAYLDGAQGGTTTTLASNVRVRFADASYSLRELDYLYDDNGNIIQVYNRQHYKSALYSYDTLNQLTAAVLPGYFGDAQTRLNYTYDSFGNLLTASDGTNTHIYEYEDAEWRDLLTAYDGHEIIYDAIGNPLQYYDNAQFVWRNGRQLQARLTAQGATVYSYQADGLRTKKALPDGSYSRYYWLDGALLAEERHTADGALAYTFVFDYDEMGAPVGFALRRGTSGTWENYFYAKNLQGDIEELYRIGATANDCDRVAYYEYDPWGKPLRVRDADGAQVSDPAHIANLNPLRYRGYYYDTDTGFYYLQSRYYDPQIGRFINADSYASTGQGVAGCNMFAYCGNNAIVRIEIGGTSWKDVISGILHACNDFAVSIGIDTAAIGAYFLDMENNDGIYQARFDCWQQYFGYNNLYDFVFSCGTKMSRKKLTFSYNKTNYIIWAWKGDYINLGAGAEVGIYYGGKYGHWLASKSLTLSMNMSLDYRGKNIIPFGSGKETWWYTGFNPAYRNVLESDLTATFVLSFSNRKMYLAFLERNIDKTYCRFYALQGFSMVVITF